MPRPLYCFFGDEDVVTHADDTIPLLLDPASHVSSVPTHGESVIQGSSPAVSVSWSIVDKRCHQSLDGQPFQLPDGTPTSTLEEVIEWMVPKALDHAANDPNPPVMPILPSSPLATQDPYDDALFARKVFGVAPSGVISDLFQPGASGFTNNGDGTWLGWSDSLLVTTPSDGRPSVYVGSAGGTVHRFEIARDGLGSMLPGEYLIETAVSHGAQPTDTDLGYGIFALAMGNVDGLSGEEIVVGSFRGIHVLRASDLYLLRERIFQTDGWPYFHPLNLRVEDLDGGGLDEITFRTKGGKLVVLNGQLQTLAELDEPGIVDLQISSAGAYAESGIFQRSVVSLSHRRQLHAIDLNGVGLTPPAWLQAASVPLVGEHWDLEPVTWDGSPAWAVISRFTLDDPNQPDSVRIFDAATLAQVHSLGLPPPGTLGLPGQPPEDPSEGIDLEISEQGGQLRFLVLDAQDNLRVFSSGGVEVGTRSLTSYAPAAGALAIEVGDLDGNASTDEVVVATRSGHLMWFHLYELFGTSNPDIGITRTLGYERTNRTLSATWGMSFGPDDQLHVVDQSGTRWEVDPVTGVATYADEFRDGGIAPVRDLRHGPVRDLHFVGVSDVEPTSTPAPGDPTAWVDPVGRRIRTGTSTWTRTFILNFGFAWVELPFYSWINQDFALFEGAGDVMAWDQDTYRMFWWNGIKDSDRTLNSLHSAVIERVATNPDRWEVREAWNSVGVAGAANEPLGPNQLDLRNDQRGLWSELEDVQMLRLGRVRSATGEPDVVVSTVGGSILLIDPDLAVPDNVGSIVAESEDYGWGGMALCLADLDGDGDDEVIFGTITAPTNGAGGPMKGSIHILDWAGTGFVEIGSRLLTEYGVCGLAVGDVVKDPSFPGPELVIGTLQGDLIVFDLTSSGGIGSVLHRTGFIGAVGAYNSILIEDRVSRVNGGATTLGGDGRSEIYVATTAGLVRLDVK